MWESPIETIYGDLRTVFEGEVVKAIQKIGINVKKEELIKALEYDRKQYEKGYAEAKAEIIRCKDCGHYDGRPCGIVDYYNTENDYCSKAILRGDSE